MNRTFKFFTLAVTGTPQPVFGTTLSAAFVPATDGLGNPVPGAVVSVADAELPWRKNDRVIVVETDGSLSEGAYIVDIDTVGVTLTLSSLKFAHASGARVILNAPVSSVYIQRRDGGAADMGIGNARDVDLTTGLHLISKIINVNAGVQPMEFGSPNIYGANPGSTAEYWVVGTNPDVYLPSFIYT